MAMNCPYSQQITESSPPYDEHYIEKAYFRLASPFIVKRTVRLYRPMAKLPRHAINFRTLILSGLRPQPIGNPTRDLCGRLHGDREYRTDVDLAKHVAVGSVSARRAEHEVRIPDHRKIARLDGQQGGQLRRPHVLHQPTQALEARLSI